VDVLSLKTFEQWESAGDMTSEMAAVVDRGLDEIVERKIKGIEELIDKQPYLATLT